MQEFTEKYGIAIGRFQVDHPHDGHLALLDTIQNNHKEMIIFLGVPHIKDTELNPLSFDIRKGMLQELYPRAFIMPVHDVINDDKKWSEKLDNAIEFVTNNQSVLIYGSRLSFISTYQGKYKTFEFQEHGMYISATKLRHVIASEIINTRDFRKGIIYTKMNQRPVIHPTVDIVIYNQKGQILLGRKPYEDKFRCIGGFVDKADKSYEHAGRREHSEETNKVEISTLKYVCSMNVDDPRYRGLKDGIMTTLLIGEYVYGDPQPTDDIAELAWKYPNEINIKLHLMPVHHELFEAIFEYMHKNDLCNNSWMNKITG